MTAQEAEKSWSQSAHSFCGRVLGKLIDLCNTDGWPFVVARSGIDYDPPWRYVVVEGRCKKKEEWWILTVFTPFADLAHFRLMLSLCLLYVSCSIFLYDSSFYRNPNFCVSWHEANQYQYLLVSKRIDWKTLRIVINYELTQKRVCWCFVQCMQSYARITE